MVQEEQSNQRLSVQQIPSPEDKPKYAVCQVGEIYLVVSGGGKLLKHPLKCNGVAIYAVADTGATRTVMDEDVAQSLELEARGPMVPLVGANGSALIAKGSIRIRIECEIDGVVRIAEHDVIVVRNLTAPMLMGIDLMKKLQVNVNISTMQLQYGLEKPKSKLKLSETVVIPARSQAVLEAKTNLTGTVITVPRALENGLSVANSVALVNEGIIPLVILNPFKKSVIVNESVQLGDVEEFDEEIPSDSNSEFAENICQVNELGDWQRDIKVGENLDEVQREQLLNTLKRYSSAFSLKGEIGRTDVAKHKIELLPHSEPVVEPLRRRAQTQIDETRKQVNELINARIVEESNSPWASAYVLVKKKSGDYRLCIDFRKLNHVTKKVVYPLPNVDECLETLSGKNFFTQLDFRSGFWQIVMEESSKELTAFRTEDGQFQFKRMPFGLTNAPATFQRMINTVLAGLNGINLQVFIDDICIATETWAEHLMTLEATLKAVINAQLKIKIDKCVFASHMIKFLGHEISASGIRQDPDKLRALIDMPPPQDTKGVKRSLGMFSYYRKFVNNFAALSEPLTKLTRKGTRFEWGREQSEAYKGIIEQLSANLTLAHFNHEDPIMVKTDASKAGVAGMLLQRHEDEWRLIACCSRRLSSSETNYGITDLEGLAVVYTLAKFRPYLLGKKFLILVDHCALCVLAKRKCNSSRIMRWAIALSEYNFDIRYTKGSMHCDIDCMSRAPVDDPVDPYLEDKVYMVVPFDKHTWLYTSNEEREIFQQAFDKEGDLRVVEGLVYKGDLLFVPEEKRFEIVYSTHNANMNAHPGIAATISKLKENYWWPKMHLQVENVISQCSTCLAQKPHRVRPAGIMRSFEIYEPGEQVAIDLIENLKESVNGNQHIIVAVDMFTRFVEAAAVPDKSAPTLTEFIIKYCGRFGVPHTFLTDCTTSICNEFTSQVIKVFGASHVKSTPFHSQGNSVVERVNQTLEEKVRLVIDDPLNERSWDSVLPIAVLAINTAH